MSAKMREQHVWWIGVWMLVIFGLGGLRCSSVPTEEQSGETPVSTEGGSGKESTSVERVTDSGVGDESSKESTVGENQEQAVQESGSETVGDTVPESPAHETTGDDADCRIPGQVNDPEARKTTEGWVKGNLDGTVWSFRGIPYAAPPVGTWRWKPPQKPRCWSDIRDARDFGPTCLQLDDTTKQIVGDEDCLTLNVWSPTQATPDKPLPVMFFIHGGGNVQGSSRETLPGGKLVYNGKNLAERGNVVVVSINYRLGALGYLAHPALSQESGRQSSGNYGILDQIQALQWVQQNIRTFGGDPKTVMIFGESAGAVNTSVLYASPLAKGLFHRALLQSGSYSRGVLASAAENAGLQRVAKTSCTQQSDVLACLRNKDGKTIIQEMPGAINVGSLGTGDPLQSYGPIVDGWVLRKLPRDAITAKEHNDVPLIVGSNRDEMDNLLKIPVPDAKTFETLVRAQLKGVAESDIQLLLKVYNVNLYASARHAMVDLMTDATFTCNAIFDAATAAQSQTSKVWRYFFARRAKTSNGAVPARHAIELLYIFHSLTDVPLFTPTQEDLQLANTIIAYWSHFAKTGDTNAPSTPVSWTSYQTGKDNTLVLDVPSLLQEGVRQDRCSLWTKIFTQLSP